MPITKVIAITTSRFLVRGSCAPMPSPIGVMETSVPSEKKAMPTMSSTAPARNRTSVPTGMGVIVMLSSRTISVIGSTEESASWIFSCKILFILNLHIRKDNHMIVLYRELNLS